MQTQIRSLVINPAVQIVTVSLVALTGLFHMALGATYANQGSPFTSTDLISLYAGPGGIDGQPAFLIIGGIFIMFACAFLLWNLKKNSSNKRIAFISWILCTLVVFFDFTGAVIAAQIYTPVAKYVSSLGLGLDIYGKKQHMYNFALVDTIITFVLAIPSVFYLFLATIYHRSKLQNDQEAQQNQGEQMGANHANQTQMKNTSNPQQDQQFRSSPKSIDLERQHAYHMGEKEGRMGSVMYKAYNSSQSNQQPQPHFGQAPPQFTTSQNVQLSSTNNIPNSRSPPKKDGAPKRSKTQFAHSEPDFNVNMSISANRRSIDPKVLESSTSPK